MEAVPSRTGASFTVICWYMMLIHLYCAVERPICSCCRALALARGGGAVAVLLPLVATSDTACERTARGLRELTEAACAPAATECASIMSGLLMVRRGVEKWIDPASAAGRRTSVTGNAVIIEMFRMVTKASQAPILVTCYITKEFGQPRQRLLYMACWYIEHLFGPFNCDHLSVQGQ